MTMGADPTMPEPRSPVSPDLPSQDELPEEELDETRRRDQPTGPDPVSDAGLPGHEQDERRVEDTGGQPTNP
jgi:hypothetical protein